MLSKKGIQETVISSFFGILAVCVAGYLAYSGNFPLDRAVGFLGGLVGGYLSVLAVRLRALNPSRLRLLRVVEIVLSPLGFIVLLPFSYTMAGGYFLGSAASFCFGWALLSLTLKASE